MYRSARTPDSVMCPISKSSVYALTLCSSRTSCVPSGNVKGSSQKSGRSSCMRCQTSGCAFNTTLEEARCVGMQLGEVSETLKRAAAACHVTQPLECVDWLSPESARHIPRNRGRSRFGIRSDKWPLKVRDFS